MTVPTWSSFGPGPAGDLWKAHAKSLKKDPRRRDLELRDRSEPSEFAFNWPVSPHQKVAVLSPSRSKSEPQAGGGRAKKSPAKRRKKRRASGGGSQGSAGKPKSEAPKSAPSKSATSKTATSKTAGSKTTDFDDGIFDEDGPAAESRTPRRRRVIDPDDNFGEGLFSDLDSKDDSQPARPKARRKKAARHREKALEDSIDNPWDDDHADATDVKPPKKRSAKREARSKRSPARGDGATGRGQSKAKLREGSGRRNKSDQEWRVAAAHRQELESEEDLVIISRPDHCISRKDIDSDALKVLYRLHRNGFKAYLVGGGVRDLLVGRLPKDYDIATDAKPRRLKKMFRNCRIIGRRFRLAHLHYPGDKIIEVATFRSSPESDEIERDGDLIRRDNVFGTPAEDARRRDLTINGLFYSIADFSVIDYVGGVEDLRRGVVRMIRDPRQSFREDPVRMLRAIRHATRLGFEISDDTHDALESERDEILKANSARLLEEFYKDLSGGKSTDYFRTLHESKFLTTLVPELTKSFRKRGERAGEALFYESLERLDELKFQGVEITHAIGLAALFSPLILPVARTLEDGKSPGATPYEAYQEALGPALTHLRIYRRDSERLWHILGAWTRVALAFERDSIPQSLLKRQYFPEAIEIFGLLSDSSAALESFVEFARTQIPPLEEQVADPDTEPGRKKRKKRKRRRRRQED